MGADVPVYQGASRPILQQREHAAEYHGEDGFGNTSCLNRVLHLKTSMPQILSLNLQRSPRFPYLL